MNFTSRRRHSLSVPSSSSQQQQPRPGHWLLFRTTRVRGRLCLQSWSPSSGCFAYYATRATERHTRPVISRARHCRVAVAVAVLTQKMSQRDQQAGRNRKGEEGRSSGCLTRIQMNGLDLEVGQVKLLACPIYRCERLTNSSLVAAAARKEASVVALAHDKITKCGAARDTSKQNERTNGRRTECLPSYSLSD